MELDGKVGVDAGLIEHHQRTETKGSTLRTFLWMQLVVDERDNDNGQVTVGRASPIFS